MKTVAFVSLVGKREHFSTDDIAETVEDMKKLVDPNSKRWGWLLSGSYTERVVLVRLRDGRWVERRRNAGALSRGPELAREIPAERARDMAGLLGLEREALADEAATARRPTLWQR